MNIVIGTFMIVLLSLMLNWAIFIIYFASVQKRTGKNLRLRLEKYMKTSAYVSLGIFIVLLVSHFMTKFLTRG